jgi:hypothetical protein
VAIATPGNEYAARSCYYQALRPYLGGPLAERLLVVTFEALTGDDLHTWHQVLAHIGLPARSRERSAANTRASSLHYTRSLRFLLDRVESRRLDRIPAPLRKVGRRFLVRPSGEQETLESTVNAPIPDAVADRWRAEAQKLATSLGWAGSPWPTS